jgi:hypothetical protein
LCMDTMTELTYLSNHFFDGRHIHFGINTNVGCMAEPPRYTCRFNH